MSRVKRRVTQPELFPSIERDLILSRSRFSEALARIDLQEEHDELRTGVAEIRTMLRSPGGIEQLLAESTEDSILLRRDVLLSELDQIVEARTIERARYYLRRLRRGLEAARTSGINDINLRRWKEYDDVITDSLWSLPRRDTSGAHLGWYWGNFVPQIPHQLILRFTRKGEWVLDPFAGSGTTLIECKRLGRNGIGIELSAKVAGRARELIDEEPEPASGEVVVTDVVAADSRSVNVAGVLADRGVERVQLVIMHPPYHDIVNFSDDSSDLSNAASTERFLAMFCEVLDNITPLLDRGRYLALVVGDKYAQAEWIPLGFYCMTRVMERDFSLKSVIVKNFDETRAKREQKQLWRYRALVGGFYIFKHEYIFLFRKK